MLYHPGWSPVMAQGTGWAGLGLHGWMHGAPLSRWVALACSRPGAHRVMSQLISSMGGSYPLPAKTSSRLGNLGSLLGTHV